MCCRRRTAYSNQASKDPCPTAPPLPHDRRLVESDVTQIKDPLADIRRGNNRAQDSVITATHVKYGDAGKLPRCKGGKSMIYKLRVTGYWEPFSG